MDSFNSSVVVLIATLVFFSGVALEHFGLAEKRDWVRIAVGVSAVVIALYALFALL